MRLLNFIDIRYHRVSDKFQILSSNNIFKKIQYNFNKSTFAEAQIEEILPFI